MDLGQVFTRKVVADFMVSLIDKPLDAKILDPCFGEGVFLRSLEEKGYYNLAGCEIDKNLFGKAQRSLGNAKLICDDFLKLPLKSTYDAIIMNPPYIRHEKIDDLKDYGISKKDLRNKNIFSRLPKNANMYMYFVIKSLYLLKENGVLVAIFPRSWTNANVGTAFEKMIEEIGSIEQRIFMQGQIFEEHVLVDVLILKIVKAKDEVNTETKYMTVSKNEIAESLNGPDNSLEIDPKHIGFTDYLGDTAYIRRGLTTGFNKMYMNAPLKNESKNIISSPKNIPGYRASLEHSEKIFFPTDLESLSFESLNYIKTMKEFILQNKKPKTLYRKIISGNNDWFLLKEISGEGIIFSYMIRENTKFVLNKDIKLVRDNFYIIQPSFSLELAFALLNNYYTYYQLESYGKRYGAGMLKLQKYDLEKIMIPNIKLISEDDLLKLEKLGKDLSYLGEKKYIYKITKVLSKYSNIHVDVIKKAYYEKRNKRLGGKQH